MASAGRFSRSDHAASGEALKGLRGAFILSINDVPEVRQLFAWATIEPVATTYTVTRGKGTAAAELIISAGTP